MQKKTLTDDIIKLKDSAKYYVNYIAGYDVTDDLDSMLDVLSYNLHDYRKYILNEREQLKILNAELNKLRKTNSTLIEQLRNSISQSNVLTD